MSLKSTLIPSLTVVEQSKITYCLFDVLFSSLCEIIAGTKGWFDIREYILGHHEWFKRNGLFLKDIPADDTIAHIISRIDPELFHACFINWMSAVHSLTEGQVVAIDGKGALVTIDAMACQTEIAKTIIDQDADYLLAVKSNQGNLRKAVEKAFAKQRATKLDDINIEQNHGHVEVRQSHVLSAEELEGDFSRWKELKSIVMVENFRYQKGKAPELEYRYYISSKQLSVEQAANAVREH